MTRLLGVITGSALAVATLLLVVGIPEFGSETADPGRVPVRLPRPTLPVEQAETLPQPASPSPAAAGADSNPHAKTPVPSAAAADGAPAADTPPPVAAAAGETVGGTGEPVSQPAPGDDARWYAFWSPFHSRIAAEGFVARLQSVTGLDYRIVRRETGVYDVAFAYADDQDIVAHLSRISAATGLDLPEAP